MSRIIYHFGLAQVLPVLAMLKTKTYHEDGDKQNAKIKGSTIIISNHRALWDGITIALRFFTKRLHYLVVDWYKNKNKFLKPIVAAAGGIFIDRGGFSFDFIDKCRKVTAKGRPILMFPEGAYRFDYEPSKFSPGYIMLAAKTGAKILPIASDLNYGLFKRVHLMIGKSIDLSCYMGDELTKEKINQLNEQISHKFNMLFYKLKAKKAQRFSSNYEFIEPKKGDVIRVLAGSYHHYGVYLNANEVIQFGHAVNVADKDIVVNSVTFKEFCGQKIPEVRSLKKREKRYLRNADEIEKYAKSCIGKGGYCLANNNCYDFANRVTLKI